MKTKNKTIRVLSAAAGTRNEPKVVNLLREQNELLGVIIGLLHVLLVEIL